MVTLDSDERWYRLCFILARQAKLDLGSLDGVLRQWHISGWTFRLVYERLSKEANVRSVTQSQDRFRHVQLKDQILVGQSRVLLCGVDFHLVKAFEFLIVRVHSNELLT